MSGILPTVTELLSRYGLVAVAVGTLFEGETVLILAGALAGRQLLPPIGVWITAALGAWVGHLIFFAVGRVLGKERLIRKFPRLRSGLEKADAFIRKRRWSSVFGLQYLYGMRIVGAIAFGLSRLSTGWFAAAEALNCLIWAALIGGAGYLMGEEAGQLFHGSMRNIWVVVSALIVMLIYLQIRKK